MTRKVVVDNEVVAGRYDFPERCHHRPMRTSSPMKISEGRSYYFSGAFLTTKVVVDKEVVAGRYDFPESCHHRPMRTSPPMTISEGRRYYFSGALYKVESIFFPDGICVPRTKWVSVGTFTWRPPNGKLLLTRKPSLADEIFRKVFNTSAD